VKHTVSTIKLTVNNTELPLLTLDKTLTVIALDCKANNRMSPFPGALARSTLASIFWKGVEWSLSFET